jgi:nucleotide-binding universal stress UspA family protein
MKTYLVPVDFSQASVHAADFAAALSHQTDVDHIILLNAYYVSVYETILPNPDMVLIKKEQIEQNAAERIKQLESLKRKMHKKVRPGVEVSIHLNRSHLLRAVIENAIDKKVDLVVLGSRGNSSNDDALLGSHVIKISKASPVPVIVVPPAYNFETIKRVVVACDFNRVNENVPLDALKKILTHKKLELLVVNVDNKIRNTEEDAERMAEQTTLYAMLKEFNPRYYYVNQTNIIDGILQFAADKDAQLVIALPHKYSFLQSLLHNSVSQQLAESSATPVLMLK